MSDDPPREKTVYGKFKDVVKEVRQDLKKGKWIAIIFLVVVLAWVGFEFFKYSREESIQNLRANIADLRKQNGELSAERDKLQLLNKMLEGRYPNLSAEQRLDKLIEMLKTVQDRLPKQRGFSAEALTKIIKNLKDQPSRNVVLRYNETTEEECNLAKEVERAFSEGGCRVVPIPGVMIGVVKGMQIKVHNKERNVNFVPILRDILKAIGSPSNLVLNEGTNHTDFEVKIGYK